MPTHPPILVVMGRQNITTCQHVLSLSLTRGEPVPPAVSPGVFLAPGRLYWCQDLGKR
jgi:hypothetical protein